MRFKDFYLLEYSYSCTMLQVSKPLAEKININTIDKTNEILFTNKDNKEVFFKS